MPEIELTQGKTTIVDDEDYKWLMGWKWSTSSSNNGRYISAARRDGVYMSREIMKRVLDRDLRDGEWVDHINRNTLDNRRSNLRISTPSQNIANRGKKVYKIGKKPTSLYKGVYRRKNGKWGAAISIDGNPRRLGSFDTEWEAALAYNEKAAELYGEYAYLNSIADMDMILSPEWLADLSDEKLLTMLADAYFAKGASGGIRYRRIAWTEASIKGSRLYNEVMRRLNGNHIA